MSQDEKNGEWLRDGKLAYTLKDHPHPDRFWGARYVNDKTAACDSEETAARVVKLMNACAGMDDPEEEIERLRDRLALVHADNDELREEWLPKYQEERDELRRLLTAMHLEAIEQSEAHDAGDHFEPICLRPEEWEALQKLAPVDEDHPKRVTGPDGRTWLQQQTEKLRREVERLRGALRKYAKLGGLMGSTARAALEEEPSDG